MDKQEELAMPSLSELSIGATLQVERRASSDRMDRLMSGPLMSASSASSFGFSPTNSIGSNSGMTFSSLQMDLMPPGVAKKQKLLVLGMGYTGSRVAAAFQEKLGFNICGTVRSARAKLDLIEKGIKQVYFMENGKLEIDSFRLLEDVTHVLMCIPPQVREDDDRDLVLEALESELKKLSTLEWVGYISSISVYGDSNGEIVDETWPLTAQTSRGNLRIKTEAQWLESGLPIHVFRVGGIYGPGRGPIAQIQQGVARRIDLPDKVFNRIHVDDIVNILLESVAKPNPGSIYNAVDDEPATGFDVVTFACTLMNIPPPPPISWAEAEATMSAMARSFYEDTKRISNAKVKDELGVAFLYPTYREGFAAQLEEESIEEPISSVTMMRPRRRRTHICFIVNRGALKTEPFLDLRAICANLSRRFDNCVHFIPSSCSLSDQIPASQLHGEPAELFENVLVSVVAAGETTEFVVLPLFIGNSGALTEYIPITIDTIRAKEGSPPQLRYSMGRCLVDISKPSDNRVARILAKKVTALCSTQREEGTSVRVLVVDHGTSNPEVHLSRDLIGSQLAKLLGNSVDNVQTASLEGHDKDFNKPLLASSFDEYEIHSGLVILALLFLSSDQHTGPDGDIEAIVRETKEKHPNLEIAVTSPLGSHPILTDMLTDRYFEAIKDW
ncbi:hypothetical protein Ae201684P_022105 [Aphanomyces euteiches]|uniref:NAD(P)-binding domain-containing protein n=2 Tax=Aphanomyces euteiches TaxID=100861 RepID=A0A6G0WAA8_9STRA|nr:hypothetical protein Ae201684_017809 [Aphanomyces euteiches]KAH9072528.1 hypothetical protein Ae201684P_022105 [Aphanomyces euteiches]KAH9144527.1 hypothetical protein AeRB84_011523 [Aphanomyces euteiches]